MKLPLTSDELDCLRSLLPYATGPELTRIRELLQTDDEARLAVETSLYRFVRAAWSIVESAPFIDGPHILAICEHLQAVTEGRVTRLLINIPPGCSKSLLVCVFWPMWEWATRPATRWFFSSYDQRLSTRDSVRCRALMQSPWYRGHWGKTYRLTGDQNQKTYYENSSGGYRLATSIGGHGTGEHPDRVICDDPHDVSGAASAAERQAVLDWYDQTMTTRGVSRQAAHVIIMQRLHQEDLSGHVLKRAGWDHICLPMRFVPGRMKATSLGWSDWRTEPGALLCPEQFPERAVKEMEQGLGRAASGQLQQDPAPEGGSEWPSEYFPDSLWFDRWPEDIVVRVLALDPSMGKESKLHDYPAFVLLGVDQEGTLWADAVMVKEPLVQVVERGIGLCREWKPLAFAIETNQFQLLLAEQFKRRGIELSLTLPIWRIDNHVNKIMRIRTIGPYLARKDIRIKNSPGGQILVQQLKDFPAGVHDDGPDSLDQAIRMLRHLLGDQTAADQPQPLGQQ